jgi:rubredoxin
MAYLKKVYTLGKERDLPNIVTIIDEAGIDGVGWDEAVEETCAASIGEDRRPRNIEPKTIFIAIPCPTGCEECKVTKNGFLSCTKASTGLFLVDGRVEDQ